MLKPKKIIILAVIIIVAGLALVFAFSDKYSLIITLNNSDGYLFEIKSSNDWEVSRPIYCSVTKDSNVIVPLHMIGTTVESIDNLQFMIVEDEQNVLSSVIEKSAPHVILAIFDFKNQSYWPFRSPNQTIMEAQNEGKKLIGLLNRDKTKLYMLGSEVPGNQYVKVVP